MERVSNIVGNRSAPRTGGLNPHTTEEQTAMARKPTSKPTSKPNPVNPNPNDTMNTASGALAPTLDIDPATGLLPGELPFSLTISPDYVTSAVPSPVVADNAAPNGAPTTSADPADLTNAADVEAVSADIEATIKGYPGGVPAKEGGFPPLLSRTLDTRLGACRTDRTGATNALIRASYRAGYTIRLFDTLTDAIENGGLTRDEWATFAATVDKLSANPKVGKDDRTIAGVGRRIAAAEKSIKRAVKTMGASEETVREQGSAVARTIAHIDRSAEAQRAYLKGYRA